MFALLGPNGAGKTTTVEILEGYRRANRGRGAACSATTRSTVDRSRRAGGSASCCSRPASIPISPCARPWTCTPGYYPHPARRRRGDRARRAGRESATTRVIKLSGGQQRRLDVAIALAGDPELLFLDEPTTGFDPGARRNAWEIVKNLTALGKTVFLTTHYMDEAQDLADRVAVIAAGEIVAEGPPTHAGRPRRRATTEIRFRVPTTAEDLPPRSGGSPRRDGVVQRPHGRSHPGAARADGVGDRRGVDARGAGGPPAVARGRLPGADRRSRRPPE